VPVAAGSLPRLLGRAHGQAHAARGRVDVEALRSFVVGIHRAVGHARVEQRKLDRLGVGGDELQLDVAVCGGPAFGHATGQRGLELCQPLHPAQRLFALRAELRDVDIAAEQHVIVDQRGFDLVVPRQRRAFREHQLPGRLALGERPVRDAMLGDEPGGRLRDAGAVLRLPAERVRAVSPPAKCRVSPMSHRVTVRIR